MLYLVYDIGNLDLVTYQSKMVYDFEFTNIRYKYMYILLT